MPHVRHEFTHALIGSFLVSEHIDHPTVNGVARPFFCNGSYYVSVEEAVKGFHDQVARDMAENALNVAVMCVQNSCSQEDGGVAGAFFSRERWAALMNTFTDYVHAEVSALGERDRTLEAVLTLASDE
jgi:hypothetical protein